MQLQKRLFIPSGISTQELLGNKVAKFADKYNYLLHYLITTRATDASLTVESYIPVHSKVFEKYVTTRHTANIIYFWLQQGVIEREPCGDGKGYVVGKKSISYRFTLPYRHVKVIDIGYIDSKYEAKVDRITKEFKAGKMDTTNKANACIAFNLKELRINTLAATQHLIELAASGSYSVEKANIASVRVHAISSGDWFCTRDNVGHRIHHNYATLNKKLRKHCYVDTGETLVNIDVKNSQPVLLSVLLKDYYKQQEIPEDASKYIQLCEAGKFYEFMSAKFGIDITDDEARSSFKKTLFKSIFYGRNEAAEKYSEWACFKAVFPSVATFITLSKAKDYTALSIALQRLESSIIVEGVIGKIAEQRRPETFFALTIHDSITTTSSNADYVLRLMQEEFANHEIYPSFTTENIN